MRAFSYAFLTSASFAALAIAAPANAQTPEPVNPERDPCQAPADQRDPKVNCPPADTAGWRSDCSRAQWRPRLLKKAASSSSVRASAATASIRPTRSPSSTATLRSMQASTRRPKFFRASASPAAPAQINDTFGGLVVEGGPGVNTLSLRGLGPTRTLILLNGRRIAPAGTRGQVGAADLNVLPNAILDRIEVLNTGASSIYGSDAVAGVVNIVTLSKFNGLAVEASIRRSGDRRWHDAALLRSPPVRPASASRSSDRSSCSTVIASPRVTSHGPAARSSAGCSPLGVNDYGQVLPARRGRCDGQHDRHRLTIIGTNPIRPISRRASRRLRRAITSTVNRWRPDPAQGGSDASGLRVRWRSAVQLHRPQSGFGTNLNVRDTFAPSLLQQDIISPTRNYTGYLTGTYDTDFFGNGQLYTELLVTRRKSQQNGQRQLLLDYPVSQSAARRRPAVCSRASEALRAARNRCPRVRRLRHLRQPPDAGLCEDLRRLPRRPAVSAVVALRPVRGKELVGRHVQLRADPRPIGSGKAWTSSQNPRPLARSVCRDTSGGCVAAPILTPAIIGWPGFATLLRRGSTMSRTMSSGTPSSASGPPTSLLTAPCSSCRAARPRRWSGIEYRKSSINDRPVRGPHPG